jgi:nucleoside-diphosphate-sugar epimerase
MDLLSHQAAVLMASEPQQEREPTVTPRDRETKPRRKVLITGAAGHIGRCLLAGFGGDYDLRAFDRAALDGPWESVAGDLTDLASLLRAMQGIEVVVHLAATRKEAPFVEDLVPNNIVGLYNTLEAAREAGVRRVVFASSAQTVAAYPKGDTITIDHPPHPSSLYGATKVFGETLGRFYHDRYGLEFVALRIGWFLPPGDERLRQGRSIWLSPSDALHLFRAAIEKPDVGFAIVFGTSKTEGERLSQDEAREQLGYEPRDDVKEFVL